MSYICEQIRTEEGEVHIILKEPDGTRHSFSCGKIKRAEKMICSFNYVVNGHVVPIPHQFNIYMTSMYTQGPEPSELTKEKRIDLLIFEDIRYVINHKMMPVMEVFWLDGMLFNYIIKPEPGVASLSSLLQ